MNNEMSIILTKVNGNIIPNNIISDDIDYHIINYTKDKKNELINLYNTLYSENNLYIHLNYVPSLSEINFFNYHKFIISIKGSYYPKIDIITKLSKIFKLQLECSGSSMREMLDSIDDIIKEYEIRNRYIPKVIMNFSSLQNPDLDAEFLISTALNEINSNTRSVITHIFYQIISKITSNEKIIPSYKNIICTNNYDKIKYGTVKIPVKQFSFNVKYPLQEKCLNCFSKILCKYDNVSNCNSEYIFYKHFSELIVKQGDLYKNA